MDKLKERFEFIIGYGALLLALSAFKDELKAIQIDFSIISFDLSQYVFCIVISFFISLQVFVIPYIFNSTKYSYLKVFRYIEFLAYLLFTTTVLSPILISILYLIKIVIDSISSLPVTVKDYSISIISGILGIITQIIATKLIVNLKKDKLKKEQKEIEEQEVKDLDFAQKLFLDQYYNLSIFEAYKVLENHIHKLLISKDIRVNRNRLSEMLDLAFKYKLITENDLGEINSIRKLRNNIAHLEEVSYSKEEAYKVLNYVKELIKKNFKIGDS